MLIRDTRPSDQPALEALYPGAFPDEDLLPLVRDLLKQPAGIISLAAIKHNAVIGHIAFTSARTADSEDKQALLAPLAVDPSQQRRGVGSELVRTGLARLTADGFTKVYVLGDPNYYARFGFEREPSVTPPYPLPADWREAWRSMHLQPRQPPYQGGLILPALWRHPNLWGS